METIRHRQVSAVVRATLGAAETAAAVLTAVGGSAGAAADSPGSISLDQLQAALTSALEARLRANSFALAEVDAIPY